MEKERPLCKSKGKKTRGKQNSDEKEAKVDEIYKAVMQKVQEAMKNMNDGRSSVKLPNKAINDKKETITTHMKLDVKSIEVETQKEKQIDGSESSDNTKDIDLKQETLDTEKKTESSQKKEQNQTLETVKIKNTETEYTNKTNEGNCIKPKRGPGRPRKNPVITTMVSNQSETESIAGQKKNVTFSESTKFVENKGKQHKLQKSKNKSSALKKNPVEDSDNTSVDSDENLSQENKETITKNSFNLLEEQENEPPNVFPSYKGSTELERRLSNEKDSTDNLREKNELNKSIIKGSKEQNSSPVYDWYAQKTAQEKFQKTQIELQNLGYDFLNENRLVKFENGKITKNPFKYNPKNEAHYQEVAEKVTKYVQGIMETDYDMRKFYLFNGTYVYATPDFRHNPEMTVIIHGSGNVQSGVWARKICCSRGLTYGSQLPYIKHFTGKGQSVVCLNTNEPHHKTTKKPDPYGHAKSAFAEVIMCAGASRINIIAFSAGGSVLVQLIEDGIDFFRNYVYQVTLLDSIHGQNPEKYSEDTKIFLKDRGVHYIRSKQDLGKELTTHDLMKTLSANTTDHDDVPNSAFYLVTRDLDHTINNLKSKEASNKQSQMENMSVMAKLSLKALETYKAEERAKASSKFIDTSFGSPTHMSTPDINKVEKSKMVDAESDKHKTITDQPKSTESGTGERIEKQKKIAASDDSEDTSTKRNVKKRGRPSTQKTRDEDKTAITDDNQNKDLTKTDRKTRASTSIEDLTKITEPGTGDSTRKGAASTDATKDTSTIRNLKTRGNTSKMKTTDKDNESKADNNKDKDLTKNIRTTRASKLRLQQLKSEESGTGESSGKGKEIAAIDPKEDQSTTSNRKTRGSTVKEQGKKTNETIVTNEDNSTKGDAETKKNDLASEISEKVLEQYPIHQFNIDSFSLSNYNRNRMSLSTGHSAVFTHPSGFELGVYCPGPGEAIAFFDIKKDKKNFVDEGEYRDFAAATVSEHAIIEYDPYGENVANVHLSECSPILNITSQCDLMRRTLINKQKECDEHFQRTKKRKKLVLKKYKTRQIPLICYERLPAGQHSVIECVDCKQTYHQACVDSTDKEEQFKCLACTLPYKGIEWADGGIRNSCTVDNTFSCLALNQHFNKDFINQLPKKTPKWFKDAAMAASENDDALCHLLLHKKLLKSGHLTNNASDCLWGNPDMIYLELGEKKFLQTRNCTDTCKQNGKQYMGLPQLHHDEAYQNIERMTKEDDLVTMKKCLYCGEIQVRNKLTLADKEEPVIVPFQLDETSYSARFLAENLADSLVISGQQFELKQIIVNQSRRGHFMSLIKHPSGKWLAYDGMYKGPGRAHGQRYIRTNHFRLPATSDWSSEYSKVQSVEYVRTTKRK